MADQDSSPPPPPTSTPSGSGEPVNGQPLSSAATGTGQASSSPGYQYGDPFLFNVEDQPPSVMNPMAARGANVGPSSTSVPHLQFPHRRCQCPLHRSLFEDLEREVLESFLHSLKGIEAILSKRVQAAQPQGPSISNRTNNVNESQQVNVPHVGHSGVSNVVRAAKQQGPLISNQTTGTVDASTSNQNHPMDNDDDAPAGEN